MALRLASLVNRRGWSDPNLEHPEKYAGPWFQPVQQNVLFNKDTSFFAPGCRDRESGGSGAIGFGSVRGLGTGLFVGGSRFVESCGVYWAGRLVRRKQMSSRKRLNSMLLC
jgi:hypothetical protein